MYSISKGDKMTDATRVYHPLNGHELLEWILADARSKLLEYSCFSIASAYHNPVYTLDLKVRTFDAQGLGDYAATASVQASKITKEKGEEKDKVISAQVKSDSPLFEPDMVRENYRLGLYETVMDDGIMVEKKKP